MQAFLAIFLIASTALGGCRSNIASDPEAEIRAVLDAQVEAWNAGDIEGYLDGYLRSPALVFAGRGTFTRGWEPLLRRYKTAYPEGSMGKLRFDDLEIHAIGTDDAWAIGSWRLDIDGSTPHGVFTLILRRTREGWKIIHDHSSGVESPAQE